MALGDDPRGDEPDGDLWGFVPGEDPADGAPDGELAALHVVDPATPAREPGLSDVLLAPDGDRDRPPCVVHDDELPDGEDEGAGGPLGGRGWAHAGGNGDGDHELGCAELLERQHYVFARPGDAEVDGDGDGDGDGIEDAAGAATPTWPRPGRGLSEAEAGALLAAERRRLVALRAVLLAERSGWAAGQPELGVHPADGATDTYEREVDESLLDTVGAELAELEEAERRLAGHWYGWCERCHAPIPAERLRAAPTTRWCLAHCVEQADARR